MNGLNFRSLQDKHENLLQKQLKKHSSKEKQDFAAEVKEYIEQTKRAGSYITANRERDQLRANLRYWGNYVYSIDKTFPDTELAPSTIVHKLPVARIIVGILAIVILTSLIVFAGKNTLVSPPEPTITKVPATPPSNTVQPMVTQTSTTVPQSSTPEPAGFNVILSSPPNGYSLDSDVRLGGKIPIEFRGTFTNLDPRWTIHVMFIRGDKVFPIKENFPLSNQSNGNEWTIQTELTETSEEMSNAESYSVVLALSFDSEGSMNLTNSATSGLDIKDLPPTVKIIQDTSRILYRQAFKIIQGPRIVYSINDGNQYDLFTSDLYGKDIIRITNTKDYNELSPDLSPDGTKIVFVKAKNDGSNAIAIMDSNGKNEKEITAWATNKLDCPQWSPDSSYISYAMGYTSQSTDRASWNIHVYERLTAKDWELFEEPENNIQPYHTWLPDNHSIIFETRHQQPSGTIGFNLISVDSSGKTSLFFDSKDSENNRLDDIQPDIKAMENGYLFTYTTVDPEKNHNIYAVVLDSYQPFPPQGPSILIGPIMLTRRRGGDKDKTSGITFAGADHPISNPDPETNNIYYIRNKNIYRLEYRIENGKIVLILDPKDNYFDDETYGDMTVHVTDQNQSISGFDVGFMNTFFPIS